MDEVMALVLGVPPCIFSRAQEAQPHHNNVRGYEIIQEILKIIFPTYHVCIAITDDRSPALHEPVENVLP